MWLALWAASAANIGNPADVSPQAEEGLQLQPRSYPFPCAAGEGAEGGWGRSCSARSSFGSNQVEEPHWPRKPVAASMRPDRVGVRVRSGNDACCSAQCVTLFR